jgi:hypothetical protein
MPMTALMWAVVLFGWRRAELHWRWNLACGLLALFGVVGGVAAVLDDSRSDTTIERLTLIAILAIAPFFFVLLFATISYMSLRFVEASLRRRRRIDPADPRIGLLENMLEMARPFHAVWVGSSKSEGSGRSG